MPEETIDNSQEQAVFTELFDVQVTDGTEFELGLQRLTEVYQAWRKGLSEDDKGVLGAGIATGIEKASNQVETFADQMTTTLARLANTMDQIAGKVGTAFEQGLGKAAENIKAEVESTAEQIQQLEKRAKDVAAEEGGNINSRRRDVIDQAENDQAQKLRADERARASRDRIQDRKEHRDVIADLSPEARASVEPHRTPQEDVARDFASSTRGQVDAFQEKTLATVQKLTVADERERIASAASLEEKLALLKEVVAELDIVNAKLAQGPPPQGNLYSDITPGIGGEDIAELEAKEREAAALDAFNKDKARAQELQKYKRTLETGITRDESKQADRRPDEIPTQKILTAQDAARREAEAKQREADRDAASVANRRPEEIPTQRILAAQDAAQREADQRQREADREAASAANRRPDEIAAQRRLAAQEAAEREEERRRRELERQQAASVNRRPDELPDQKIVQAKAAADQEEEKRKKTIADQLERINKLTADNIELIERAKAGQGPSRADQVKSLQDEIARLQGKLGSNTSEVAGLQSTPGPLTRDDEEQRQLRVNEVLKDTANIKRQIATTERSLSRAQDLTKDISLQEQSNTATRQMLDLESKLAVARDRLQNGDRPTRSLLIESLERQVAEYQKTVERAEQEVKRLAALRPAAGAPNTEGNLAAIKNYKAAVGEATAATNRLASANAELNTAKLGFFGNLRSEMGSALETAVKFSIAYKLVFEALQLAADVVVAPFKALRDGIQYLTDLQDKTADLSAVIAQNVQYSKDQGENFAIAQKIGVQAMQALQDKAIEARVPIDNLTKTFKALLEAKASGLVGNMNELITLASQMQGIIEHIAPKGQFGAANFEKSIQDLFSGNANGDNLFIKTALNGNAAAWQQMVDRARESHDLLTQLAPALRPFLEATDRAKLNLSVLKEQFQLLLSRIEGAGAGPLFESLIEGLQQVNTWLQTNGQTVTNIISMFGSLAQSVLQLAGALVQVVTDLGGVSNAAEGVGAVIYPLVSVFTSLATAIDMAVTGARELWAALHVLGHDPDQEIQQLDNARKIRQADRDRVTQDAYRAATDPNFRPGDRPTAAEESIQKQIDELKLKQSGSAQAPTQPQPSTTPTGTAASTLAADSLGRVPVKEATAAPAPSAQLPASSQELADKQIANLEALKVFLASQRNAEPHQQPSGPPTTPEKILPTAAPEIKQALLDSAKQFGVNASLAFAVAKQESGGQQFNRLGDVKTSTAGAQGVMQLMPDTAKRFNVDATDAKQNISGGVEYVATLLKKYNNKIDLVLMAYNWGEGNVDAFRNTGKGLPTKDHPEGAPVPKETMDYVAKVKAYSNVTGATSRTTTLASPAPASDSTADKDVVKDAEAQFTKDKAKYELDLEELKTKADENRRIVTAYAQEGVLSHEEAADRITSITARQLDKFNQLSLGIVSKANATRDVIANAKFPSPEEKKAGVTRADTEVTNLTRSVNTQRAQIVKAPESEDKAAVNERRALAKEQLEQEYTLQKQSIDSQRALVSEAAQEERLTKLQQFDADRALDAQEHAATAKRLNGEAALIKQQNGSNTLAYQSAIDARDRAEEAWTQKLALYGEQRRETAYRQMLEQQRDASALRQAQINTAQAQQSVRSQVNPLKGVFGEDDQQIIDMQRRELDVETQQREAELTYALAQSKGQETQKTAELRVELERLHAARVQLLQDEISQRTSGSSHPETEAQQVIREGERRLQQLKSEVQAQIQSAQAQLQAVQAQLAAAASAKPITVETSESDVPGVSKGDESVKPTTGPDVLSKIDLKTQADDLVVQLQQLNERLKRINGDIKETVDTGKEAKGSFKKAGEKILNDVIGPDFEKVWKASSKRVADGQESQMRGAVDKVGAAVKDLPNIVDRVKQEIGIFKEGQAKGGTMGGVGELLSKGPLADALSMIPVVGPFVKAIGVGITLIADAFRSNARQIAKEIETQFDQTTKNLSSGVLGIGAGIGQVSGEVDEAISKLTNLHNNQGALHLFGFDNGALDELNKILPPMVEEMEQLLRQQAQVFTEFNNQLKQLQLQSETLGQINTQWQGINQEVAKYLDAGGDAVKANQMLALGLQDIVRQSGAELTQGYDQAVQDAIQLNNLALQRYNLQQQFKQQEFSLVNADSIERMQAGAVTRGQQLTQLRTQYQQQLDDLNSQISLEAKKVTAERQIFDIATSISDLHRQDEALQLASLQMQLQKYKDLQNAVGTITSGAATPGKGNADLSSQLSTIDAQVAKYSIALKTDQSKEDGQNQSANDAAYLLQLVQTQKTLASQLSDSAGGSLAGTGLQGEYLNAIEAAQAALNNQATYASSNAGASPWYRDVGGYITSLTSAAAGLAQNQQGILSGGNATPIGVNPAAYSSSPLTLSGLQGINNTGLSQNNQISVVVNVPAGTSTTGVGPVVADSLTQALASRSRQSIIG